MKFTLVQPSFKNYAVLNPPLGLAYLAAVLREKPICAEVVIIDANAERLSIEETVEKILDTKADVLGFTMTSPQAKVALEIIGKVKQKSDIPVVVGGPHPTVAAEDLIKEPRIDILVRAEAEETIVELCRSLNGLQPLSSVKGISFKENGAVIHNPERGLIEDLDRLPFPDWGLFPLSRYSSIAGKKKSCLPIMSSRGCPFGCIFCYKGVFGRKYRARTPKNVINELLYLIDKFKIEEFVILDDNFALDEARALEICDQIIRNKIKIPWRLSNSIAVKSSSSRLFLKLREAGCYQVSIGVESGDQAVLDYINKGIILKEIENTFKLAKAARLQTVAFFMIGNLNETSETMDKTIEFAIKLDPDFAQFTIATPYPGTQMYELVKKEGALLLNDWDDLASYSGKAVFRYKQLTPELMQEKYKEAYLRFYLRPKYIFKRIIKIFSPREFLNLIKGIGVFLRMVLKR